MNRILIATDGSPSALQAIEVGLDLAEEEGSEAIFVHVAPTKDVLPVMGGFGMAAVSMPHELGEADQVCLDDAVRIAEELGLEAKTKLLAGDPSEGDRRLCRLDRRRPDRCRLARLRRHLRRAARQRLAGDSPSDDASGADRSPGASAGRSARMKVIWATDGSGNADAALPFARELAGTGGSLIAVHCNEILYGKAPGFPLRAEDVEREAKIRAQVDELRAEGLDAKLVELTGPIVEASSMIADLAATTDADVIVVGTRGHGPLPV